MASRRQATKDDKRGNSTDRRNRKLWLVSCEKFGGDGTKVACVHCEVMLTVTEVEADRITPGGSYRRSNIQPACGVCNRQRGKSLTWVGPAMRRLASAAASA